METIIIAGGSGLIGKKLTEFWRKEGHTVRCLTRKESNPNLGLYHWDPTLKKADLQAFEGITTLVNLSGAGIADKRWSKKRVQELFDSRVKTTEFLYELTKASETLNHFMTASGIICYGYEDDQKIYQESDSFGSDVLSEITKKWEQAADLFANKTTVSKVRISVVLSAEGGAFKPIAAPIKIGFGTVLGTGKQSIPWIHIDDLIGAFNHLLIQRFNGPIHANCDNTSNEILTHTIAKAYKKRIWLPKVPSWILRLVLGELSVVVLKGLKADPSLLKKTGYDYKFNKLDEAIKNIVSN